MDADAMSQLTWAPAWGSHTRGRGWWRDWAVFPLDLTLAAMFQQTSVTFPWLLYELHALSGLKQVIILEVRSVTRVSLG